MFWAWEHAILIHINLLALRAKAYIRSIRPTPLSVHETFFTLSFFNSFCNLTEGPLHRNFGLSDRIGLGLLSQRKQCVRMRPERHQGAHYRRPSSALSNQQDGNVFAGFVGILVMTQAA